jgi:hypothetical protein
MKKGFLMIVATMILVFACSSYALAENALRLGYSYDEQLTVETGGSKTTGDAGLGLDLSYEYTLDGNSFENGFGVGYQRLRSLNDDSVTYQFIPVYAIFALEFSETETNNTYLLGKLGYDYLHVSDLPDSASTRGGLFYAFGFGMKIGPYLRTQLLYEVYNGSKSDGGIKTEYTSKAFALKCGYAF